MSHPVNSYDDILMPRETGTRLTIRVRPGLSRARSPRIVALAGGKRAVEITVAAAPEDGKANKALFAFLADAFNIPKSSFAIKSGASGRLKIVEMTGNGPALIEKITMWLNGLSGV